MKDNTKLYYRATIILFIIAFGMLVTALIIN